MIWQVLTQLIVITLHLLVINEAYYLKPVNWYLFVWLLDLTLLVWGGYWFVVLIYVKIKNAQ